MATKTTPNHKDPFADAQRALTSGQVAVICGVARRTVSKWADSGRLKAHRIPGSLDRRVMPADLLKFLRDNGCPVPPALVECVEPTKPVTVWYGLPSPPDITYGETYFDDPFAFGSFVATHPIEKAVLGDGAGVAALAQAVRLVHARHPRAEVVLMVSDDVTPYQLAEAGLDKETRFTHREIA